MSPQIALAGCIVLILSFLTRDIKRRPSVSHASWLVLAWLIIFASRPLSDWFQSGPAQTPDGYLEGSPLDRAIFFLLIAAGAVVLLRRRIPIATAVRQNAWIFVFFAYCAVSVLWSEYPFVALKRWIKDFGNVIMLLILLTERQPVEAIKAVFTRCAYLLVPLSVLFVRYFPDIGRTYSGWNQNDLMYIGVASHKNTLGALLLVSCGFLLWDLTTRQLIKSRLSRVLDRADSFLILALSVWLLSIANSATALLCTILAVGIYGVTALRLVQRRLRFAELYLIAGIGLWFLLDSTFGLAEVIVASLGRDMTLTTRTGTWDLLLANQVNPLVGAGFKSFWAGDRMRSLWLVLPNIVQAHNGYVETYLNGGMIGLALLAGMLLSGFRRIKRQVIRGTEGARLQLAFLFVALVYNSSEAAFNQLSLLWCVTLLSIADLTRLTGRPIASMTRDRSTTTIRRRAFGAAGRDPRRAGFHQSTQTIGNRFRR